MLELDIILLVYELHKGVHTVTLHSMVITLSWVATVFEAHLSFISSIGHYL